MQEQLLDRKKIKILFVLAFFCLANIYRPSLGKVQLGRPNPTQLQRLNFYLRRKKQTFYSELYALQCYASRLSVIFKKYY